MSNQDKISYLKRQLKEANEARVRAEAMVDDTLMIVKIIVHGMNDEVVVSKALVEDTIEGRYAMDLELDPETHSRRFTTKPTNPDYVKPVKSKIILPK